MTAAATGALDRLRAAAPTLSVGMVTADLGALDNEIQVLADAGVEVVHFDVMDGVFCPMMTIGPPVVKAVKTPLIKDVHLMIDDPVDNPANRNSCRVLVVTPIASAALAIPPANCMAFLVALKRSAPNPVTVLASLTGAFSLPSASPSFLPESLTLSSALLMR